MIALNDVTLVSVAGIKNEESLKSLIYSSKKIKFHEIKFITNKLVDGIPEHIKFIQCDDMTQRQFSSFMFYELFKYIDTNHCLFVHHDGFVVNSEYWDCDYLNYDWIGSPWIFNKNYPELNRVGGGGFSIRSKKILELPTKLNLKLIETGDMPYPIEDMNFCNYHYETMLSNNINFAPIDLAAKFSTEIHIDGVSRKSFGFHNFSYNPEYLTVLDTI